MISYAEEMREHLLPMLSGGHTREEVALPARRTPTRLTARQRRQVEAVSFKERGYRPFQAWHMSR